MMWIKRRYKRKSQKGKIRRTICIAAAFLLVFAVVSEMGMHGIPQEIIYQKAVEYVNISVNKAVQKYTEESDGSFVLQSYDSQGKISALSTDAKKLSELKIKLTDDITKRLNRRATIHIPMGSLTGIAMFNGRGLPVPVKLSLNGTTDIVFDTQFTSAGVNQSCHRVVMIVTSRIVSTSKRFFAEREVITQVVIAENIIVGEIPSVIAKG